MSVVWLPDLDMAIMPGEPRTLYDLFGTITPEKLAKIQVAKGESDIEHLQRRVQLDLPVPESEVKVMPIADLPATKRFRAAWVIQKGTVRVDPLKAKALVEVEINAAVEQRLRDTAPIRERMANGSKEEAALAKDYVAKLITAGSAIKAEAAAMELDNLEKLTIALPDFAWPPPTEASASNPTRPQA